MPDRQEQWAVFWCSLLSPLHYGEIPPPEADRFINQLASTEMVFPDGQRRRPSRATLWRKWKRYRDGGFEALFRKRRKDRGQPRKATPAMLAKAIELKKEQPYRSNVPINDFLQAEFGNGNRGGIQAADHPIADQPRDRSQRGVTITRRWRREAERPVRPGATR